jgi:hypothetical protein
MWIWSLLLAAALRPPVPASSLEDRLEKARAIETRRAAPHRRVEILAGNDVLQAVPVLPEADDRAWALGITFRF